MARQVGTACLCLQLQRAARAVARDFDDALRPVHLTNGQFALLMSISRPKPVPISVLAPEMGMDRTTLTASLKPLERRGLLRVAVDADDRRSRVPALTEAGRTLLVAAYPLWQRVQERTLGQVEGADANRLRSALKALSA
jgi:DNA-binding MarR family transcriptional regulator